MQDNVIERISTALASEKTLEGFVRQLLEMLELVTGMESTYLTHLDPEASASIFSMRATASRCRS